MKPGDIGSRLYASKYRDRANIAAATSAKALPQMAESLFTSSGESELKIAERSSSNPTNRKKHDQVFTAVSRKSDRSFIP